MRLLFCIFPANMHNNYLPYHPLQRIKHPSKNVLHDLVPKHMKTMMLSVVHVTGIIVLETGQCKMQTADQG